MLSGATKYDLVLLDLNLPKMSGYALCSWREPPPPAHPPAVGPPPRATPPPLHPSTLPPLHPSTPPPSYPTTPPPAGTRSIAALRI